EMSELSHIVKEATSRSLVLLDEIGRGTSTYDGLSIAWAAVEYLTKPERHVRTLFATHYHELTVLEEQIPILKNLTVDVAEDGQQVIFLHKIIEGTADKSYGIHVAEIAGIPKEMLERAESKLKELEDRAEAVKKAEEQLSLFKI
ncbi:MAG: MutS-related protein, partial [Anaerovoracaceae bacterium]